jgi:hypothetical protein
VACSLGIVEGAGPIARRRSDFGLGRTTVKPRRACELDNLHVDWPDRNPVADRQQAIVEIASVQPGFGRKTPDDRSRGAAQNETVPWAYAGGCNPQFAFGRGTNQEAIGCNAHGSAVLSVTANAKRQFGRWSPPEWLGRFRWLGCDHGRLIGVISWKSGDDRSYEVRYPLKACSLRRGSSQKPTTGKDCKKGCISLPVLSIIG